MSVAVHSLPTWPLWNGRNPVWFGNSGTDLHLEGVWGHRVAILSYRMPWFAPTSKESPLLWASPTALHMKCPGSSCSAWLNQCFQFRQEPGGPSYEVETFVREHTESQNNRVQQRHLEKKNHQSLLSCLCWFRFPFISLSCFPPHSLLVHCPGVKFIHFSITHSFKVAGFHPRLLNRNVYEWTWLNWDSSWTTISFSPPFNSSFWQWNEVKDYLKAKTIIQLIRGWSCFDSCLIVSL